MSKMKKKGKRRRRRTTKRKNRRTTTPSDPAAPHFLFFVLDAKGGVKHLSIYHVWNYELLCIWI
jgi:hypothetical protein